MRMTLLTEAMTRDSERGRKGGGGDYRLLPAAPANPTRRVRRWPPRTPPKERAGPARRVPYHRSRTSPPTPSHVNSAVIAPADPTPLAVLHEDFGYPAFRDAQ